ncbi:MAG TPA: hypothetical protein DEV93_01400 [Chloroflexi bacterium]|nr:hypothetical protein [Chloroflexota bacterium]
MDEYAGDMWRRTGTSLVWDGDALHTAATEGVTVSLRTALMWAEVGAMPEDPPDGKRVLVVTGLRTAIDVLTEAERDAVLEKVARLVRAQSRYWPEAAIVFALPETTRLLVAPPTGTVVLDLGGDLSLDIGNRIWGGAGTGANQLIESRLDSKGRETRQAIGYWLRRVS